MKKNKNVGKSWVRLMALIGVCFIGGTAMGDSIILKSAVRLAEGDRVVNLADIAELIGPEAEALGELVIMKLTASASPIEIPIRNVRLALDEKGIHWADPDIRINWPNAAGEGSLSDKDSHLPKISDLPIYFDYSGGKS